VINGVVQATRFMFHDHLGSLVRIANVDGSVAEALDYTAFGDRRAYGNPGGTGGASSYTPRGFTGHEYVDGTQVIHMNGRIYDQQLGRFLQPDPVIQEPTNAQSWNAYTYVFNNPLAYTDPSGNITLRQGLAIVIAVVAAWFGQYYISEGAYGAAFAVTVAGGFASGYVATGTFQGGAMGAFTAAITFGISTAGNLTYGQQLFARAVSGGVIESLQGGNFGSGFVAAGLTAMFMPQLGGYSAPVRTALGALIGGTISAATGGKFANGAISGAIQGAMAKRSAPSTLDQKKAFKAAINGTGDGTEGAPAHIGKLLGSAATRQQGLRLAIEENGYKIDSRKIFYKDEWVFNDDGMPVGGYTDPSNGNITFTRFAFNGNYH
jgi:RHS repeat-associated protein